MPKKFVGPKIGGDPEFFLGTPKDGVVASCGLLGGSKDAPVALGNYGSYLEDNVSVELNIPPASNGSDFLDNTNALMNAMRGMLKEKIGVRPIIKPFIDFPQPKLCHPSAFIFGCDPDFCAYDFDPTALYADYTPRTFAPDLSLGNVRCAGGHIHLSYNGDMSPHVVVVLMDALVGLPMLVHDKQGSRRANYGRAGLFRKKTYGDVKGVEWRTPSNWWLAEDIVSRFRARNAFDTILQIGAVVEDIPDDVAAFFVRIPLADLQTITQKEDVSLAKELYTELSRSMPGVMRSSFSTYTPYAFMAEDALKAHAESHFVRLAKNKKLLNAIPAWAPPPQTPTAPSDVLVGEAFTVHLDSDNS